MQTSIVIGVYQFVGFHIAKYLLDQGEEVLGVDWEEVSGENIAEKEMEIGRNSNFLYVPIHKLNHISIEQPKTIYVSCYDLSKGLREDKQEIIAKILLFLKALQVNADSQMIVLLPIEEECDMYHPILQIVDESDAAKVVFLPTIYGPWQPETMSFEAAIRQKELPEVELVLNAEDTSDALFVSDLTEIVVKLVSNNEKKIQLHSEGAHQWLQCAKLLWKDELISTYLPLSSSRTMKGLLYKVENKTSPMEGISLQKKHYQRLQLMKKWRENE